MLRRVAIGAAACCALVWSAAPAAGWSAVIVGTPGPDRLVGRDASGDLLFGGGGADTLIGADGPDVIYGVRSGNVIAAGGGDNYVEGGAGDDRITARDGRNTVYGGTGHDRIVLGNGDNYVDPGGAPDVVSLGDGNNVVNGGSGGMVLTAGNGNNVVYVGGLDSVTLGGGVNVVYVANVWNLRHVDCGGNPASRVFINLRYDAALSGARKAVKAGKITRCPSIEGFDGLRRTRLQMAGVWQRFRLVGGDGPDKLLGAHGGGAIDGRGGNNIIWADYRQETGGARARANTTRIMAGDGDNAVYGGRGTNRIRLGNGRNFVRGGAWNNTIAVGSGSNTIRLQGRGRNRVIVRGGTGYVESFANGRRPTITCADGAVVTVVYGNTRPKTNCAVVVNARTARGKRLQVQGIEHVPDSEPLLLPAPVPGQRAGVPRPG